MKRRARVEGAVLTKEETSTIVDGIFPKEKEPLPSLPELSPAVNRIIETVFQPDVLDLYATIETELQIRDALTPQAVRVSLNKAENNARIAHQIYTIGKVEFEKVKLEYLRIEAAMREAAIRELSNDKAVGLRSKQVTEADVKLRMVEMYPDEYTSLITKRAKEQEVLEHLQRLADLWQERCRTLKSLNKDS